MPNTGSPPRNSPMRVPQAGIPEMKDLVPSIGSSTHTYSALPALAAELLADDPVAGKGAVDEVAHGRFRRMVGSGHRIEAPKPSFIRYVQRSSKERQYGLSRDRSQLIDES